MTTKITPTMRGTPTIDVSYIREKYPDDIVLQQFANEFERWGTFIAEANALNYNPDTTTLVDFTETVDVSTFGTAHSEYLVAKRTRLVPR